MTGSATGSGGAGAAQAVAGTPGGLLVVHAHPDDETLSTGALLATWAAAGLPVTVVTATRGERGEVIPPELRHLEGDGPALAAHRERELAAALAALGVTDHAYLDTLPPAPRRPGEATPVPDRARASRYEDSGMVWVGTARAGAGGEVAPGAFVGVPLDEAAGRLAALIRDRRPAVVAGYDPEGGYGHPDHVRAHEVTMRALALTSGEAEPTVLWRRTGRAALAAGYRALAGERARAALGERYDELTLPDPAGPFPAVAVDDAELDLAVDARRVRPAVLAALRAHATQVQAVRALDVPELAGLYALSDRVLAPLLPDEGYVHVGGPAAALPVGVRRLP